MLAGRLRGDRFSSPGESPSGNINCLIEFEKDRVPPKGKVRELFVNTIKILKESWEPRISEGLELGLKQYEH